jgi:hypothetical protein
VAKESIAVKLLNMVKDLAEQSQKTKDRVGDRLMPISREGSIPDQDPKPVGREEWPKYFSEVREELFAIKNNLAAIDKAIDRLEI